MSAQHTRFHFTDAEQFPTTAEIVDGDIMIQCVLSLQRNHDGRMLPDVVRPMFLKRKSALELGKWLVQVADVTDAQWESFVSESQNGGQR